jgi:hypothetical protein
MKFLQHFNPFRQPTPDAMALQMLEEAKRQLLIAQDAKEYAEAAVNRHTKAIERLQKVVK